jgi:nitroreductase
MAKSSSHLTPSADATDNFFEVINTQRAIRYFRPDPVSREVLLSVIEAGTKAPSGSNRQPWAFLVVDDAPTREEISRLLQEHLLADGQMRDYFARGAESEDRTERLMMSGALGLAENLAKAPALIIPCLYPKGEGLIAGSSIYPAVQNILLAARALGLGTVLTTFNARIEPALRELLAIPDDARPAALIPIGYPDARFGPTRRKPATEVTFWGRWGQTV